MKYLFTILTLCLSSLAQTTTPPVQSFHYLTYDSTHTLVQYDCASQIQTLSSQWTINAGTLTQITVSGNVATATFSTTTYLYPGAVIAVNGSTTATLNATNTPVTGVSGSTATFVTPAPNGTYNNAGMYISTNYPLLSQNLWVIFVYLYDSHRNVIVTKQAGNSGTTAQLLACLNLTSY